MLHLFHLLQDKWLNFCSHSKQQATNNRKYLALFPLDLLSNHFPCSLSPWISDIILQYYNSVIAAEMSVLLVTFLPRTTSACFPIWLNSPALILPQHFLHIKIKLVSILANPLLWQKPIGKTSSATRNSWLLTAQTFGMQRSFIATGLPGIWT